MPEKVLHVGKFDAVLKKVGRQPILFLASPAAIEFVLAAVAQGSTAADVHSDPPNPERAGDWVCGRR